MLPAAPRTLTVLSAEPVAKILGLSGLKAMQLTSAVCASAWGRGFDSEGRRRAEAGWLGLGGHDGDDGRQRLPPPLLPLTCCRHDGPRGRLPHVPQDELLVVTDRAKDVGVGAVPGHVLHDTLVLGEDALCVKDLCGREGTGMRMKGEGGPLG